jgi:hypothetical protein
MSGIIVGIDPQQKLFGVHIRKGDETLGWFKIYMKKKCRYETAQAWQEYVWSECVTLLDRVARHIPIHAMHVQYTFPHLSCGTRPTKPDLVVIEQQKGRVHSIIEQSLLVACLQRNWNAKIMHPMSWKRKIKMDFGEGNKKNKEKALHAVLPILEQWIALNPDSRISIGTALTPADESRMHDLCDAFLISKAGQISNEENEENARQSRLQNV